MNILKKSGVAGVERELANLATRQASLEIRRASVSAALAAARDARKSALAEDDTADLTKATGAVRDATEELEVVEGVLADIVEAIAAGHGRLVSAQDVEARAAAVKALGGLASKYDAAALELDTALKSVARAYNTLVDVLPETLAVVSLDCRVIPADQQYRPGPSGLFALQSSREAAGPVDLARVILAEGLARVCPAAFPYGDAMMGYRASLERAGNFAGNPSFYHGDLSEFQKARTAREAASLLVTDRLRARASAIAAGETHPNLADRTPWTPVARAPEKEPIPEVQIYALRNFSFRLTDGGQRTLCGSAWAHQIPEDAATMAVKAGLALRTDTQEGAAAFDAQRVGRAAGRIIGTNGTLHPDDCTEFCVGRTPDDEDI